LTENRAGQILFRLVDVPPAVQADDSFYPVLGLLMGQIAQDKIPVVDGFSVTPTEDQLKAVSAAGASSGTIALFHIVGVTPEAPTREAAFQGREPISIIDIPMDRLRQARRELTTAAGEKLEMVVLGSPHFSLAEFQKLAPLLDGHKRHDEVEFLVTTSRGMRLLAEECGALQKIEAFGGKLTVDTCILATPMLPKSIKTLMTNSAKFAYYSPGLLGTQVVFGRLEDCVRSAIEGRVVRDEALWETPKE
jgi:predicted aconitase